MNVLQIGGEWAGGRQGGLNRYFSGLLRHLQVAGIEPIAMAAGERGAVDPAGESIGPIDAPLRTRVSRLCEMVRGRAEHADLLVAHFALYGLPAWRIARRHRLPYVAHFHGPWADESAAEGGGRVAVMGKRMIERRAYRPARRVITLSNAFRDVVVKRYGVDASRARVIPGGIDAEAWNVQATRAQAREELGWPANRPIVLCVRRLARRMGIDVLIEAAARVRQRHPDVLFHLAGTGPMREELEARIAAADLKEHVQLLGFVAEANLPLAYRAADVSVVPSRSLEGFGLITLESLAAGTPVLVTPVGGLPEAVSRLSNRLVLEGSSADDLAEGIASALKNPANFPKAEQCRRYVKENFDWPLIAGRVADVYREAIEAA